MSIQLKELYKHLYQKGFPNEYDDIDAFPTVIGIMEIKDAETSKNVAQQTERSDKIFDAKEYYKYDDDIDAFPSVLFDNKLIDISDTKESAELVAKNEREKVSIGVNKGLTKIIEKEIDNKNLIEKKLKLWG